MTTRAKRVIKKAEWKVKQMNRMVGYNSPHYNPHSYLMGTINALYDLWEISDSDYNMYVKVLNKWNFKYFK